MLTVLCSLYFCMHKTCIRQTDLTWQYKSWLAWLWKNCWNIEQLTGYWWRHMSWVRLSVIILLSNWTEWFSCQHRTKIISFFCFKHVTLMQCHIVFRLLWQNVMKYFYCFLRTDHLALSLHILCICLYKDECLCNRHNSSKWMLK